MDANVIPMTEKSDASPASPLETMHEAVHRAQGIFLRDLIERIKACAVALELCVDELGESGLNLDVSKSWRALDKHLQQLTDDLEAYLTGC